MVASNSSQRNRHSYQPSEDQGPSTPTQSRGADGLPPPTTYSQYKHRQSKSNGEKMTSTRGIQPGGESGRSGFHPWHFLRISGRSTSRASLVCNVLWPVVPAALAVRCRSLYLSGSNRPSR